MKGQLELVKQQLEQVNIFNAASFFNNKIVLLTKSKLSKIEFLICKALIDLKITHDKFVSINNVFKNMIM